MDRKLTGVNDTKELKVLLSQEYTDNFAKALKNSFNFLEYLERDSYNGISLEKWRKAIVLQRSGVREVYISDQELKEAYAHVEDRIVFKLLVYSGARLTHIIGSLKLLDNAVVKDNFVRIPTLSLSKGKKASFWVYLPLEVFNELKNLGDKSYDHKSVAYKRVSANSIRKWFLNKLLELEVPLDVIDFIQGRSAVGTGARHYMDKTHQADLGYRKIVEQLTKIIP